MAAAAQRTSGRAIASLICGIAGIFVLPLILSVAAIILGGSARREIEAQPELGGAGLASAGIILGWIGVALIVLWLVLLVLLVAVF